MSGNKSAVSRTTRWRRQQISECCVYHSNEQESCQCCYHLESDGDISDCCQYHRSQSNCDDSTLPPLNTEDGALSSLQDCCPYHEFLVTSSEKSGSYLTESPTASTSTPSSVNEICPSGLMFQTEQIPHQSHSDESTDEEADNFDDNSVELYESDDYNEHLNVGLSDSSLSESNAAESEGASSSASGSENESHNTNHGRGIVLPPNLPRPRCHLEPQEVPGQLHRSDLTQDEEAHNLNDCVSRQLSAQDDGESHMDAGDNPVSESSAADSEGASSSTSGSENESHNSNHGKGIVLPPNLPRPRCHLEPQEVPGQLHRSDLAQDEEAQNLNDCVSRQLNAQDNGENNTDASDIPVPQIRMLDFTQWSDSPSEHLDATHNSNNEMEDFIQNDVDAEDSDDADDPDSDPGSDDEPGSNIESDEDSDDGAQGLTLSDASLNTVLEMVPGCTKREAIAMILTTSLKHNHDYEATMNTFSILNAVLGSNMLPSTKKQLWKALHKEEAGIQKNAYCSNCTRPLGKISLLPRNVICRCGFSTLRKNVKYFISLNVRKQLQKLLNNPHTRELFLYSHNRQKKHVTALEDILDGQAYLKLKEDIHFSLYDFTYAFNTDGFSLSKSSKTEAWPILLRINELPLNVRQKYVILAGIWVDKAQVNFDLFMENFIQQANSLSRDGILWKPDGNIEEVSRFFPTVCCADAIARAGLINMTLFNGNYSCPFCNNVGIQLDGCVKLPLPGTEVRRMRKLQGVEYEERTVIPPAVARTDASMRNAMEEADNTGRWVEGIKGLSSLMLLDHFKFVSGFSTDDLHPIFKGVTEFHTQLLFVGVEGQLEKLTCVQINQINSRLKKIRTPTHISRKPRPITEMGKFKGTEWRNWLLYYAIICMYGIVDNRYLKHFALLCRAIFILDRDIITEEDLEEAAVCLDRYVVMFQDLFGPHCMRFNVHILKHVVEAVRRWGPLWAHSTFPFESWNHRFGQKVKSPKAAIDQIAMRYLMNSLVEGIDFDPTISHKIKEVVNSIRKPYQLRNVLRISNAILFGKSEDRAPSGEELELLVEAGFNCEIVEEFRQVKVNHFELRSAKYPSEGLSVNNLVYTYDGDFCQVDSIVAFVNDNINVCGLFVTWIDVGDNLLSVPHIHQITHQELKGFITVETVRNLSVTAKIGEVHYIMPMANHYEID